VVGRVLVAAVLVGACWQVPSHAGHERFECGYESVGQERVTDGRYRGAAYGYVAGGPGEDVAVSCVIKVGGVVRAATPTAAGSGAAVTAGRVAFTLRGDDRAFLCAVVAAHGTTREHCYEVVDIQIPPSEVEEAVDTVLATTWDPAAAAAFPVACAALRGLAGTYGPVTVGADGDVTADGETWRDCPPKTG
jgi:hypothetical protein